MALGAGIMPAPAGPYRLIARNAMMTPAASYIGAPSTDLDGLILSADARVRGARAFYSVDVIDVRTGAVVYTARGTA